MAYMGRLRQKEVPFSGFRYINPFAPERPVTARADPRPFDPL